MRQEGAEVALRSGCVPRPPATLLQGWCGRLELNNLVLSA